MTVERALARIDAKPGAECVETCGRPWKFAPRKQQRVDNVIVQRRKAGIGEFRIDKGKIEGNAIMRNQLCVADKLDKSPRNALIRKNREIAEEFLG